jgi:molybdopterin molybdotransferase
MTSTSHNHASRPPQASSETTTTHACDHVPNALTVEEAQANILSTVQELNTLEQINIRDSLGRVLAQPIIAAMDIPPHRNSAMDGYAIRFTDLDTKKTTQLNIAGESFAGHPFQGNMEAGECVRIMTGAVMPIDADTVIMQEHVERQAESIIIQPQHTQGQNVRHPGEDVKKGETILEPGREINAANLGLFASLGMAEINVTRKPRVAFFSTGDELKNVGSILGEGDIYDSNRYTLFGLLKKLNVELLDMGVIPDQALAVENAFKEASKISDVLITSGGVSVGEADFVSDTLKKLGHVNFWKIAMKPGKPVAFGKLDQCLFFGLPGNPVSVMATFALFVKPAIQKLKGLLPNEATNRSITAISDVDIKKAPGRKDHQRGIYYVNEAGEYRVTTIGLQSSHVLSAMSKANCFIVLDKDSGNLPAQTKVEVLPFSELF